MGQKHAYTQYTLNERARWAGAQGAPPFENCQSNFSLCGSNKRPVWIGAHVLLTVSNITLLCVRQITASVGRGLVHCFAQGLHSVNRPTEKRLGWGFSRGIAPRPERSLCSKRGYGETFLVLWGPLMDGNNG